MATSDDVILLAQASAEEVVVDEKLDSKADEDSGSDELRAAPWPEVAFYLACFAAAIAFGVWDFYLKYGRDPTKELSQRLIKPGWLTDWMEVPLDRLEQDLLDNRWFLIGSFLGFVLVSQLTLRLAPCGIHHLATAAYTLGITMLVVSFRATLYMLLIFTGAVFMAYFSLAGVWVIVLSPMVLQNTRFNVYLVQCLDITGIGHVIHYPILGYLFCRAISAGHSLNRMLRQQRASGLELPTLLQFLRQQLPKSLAYGFYYPWHYCGPILTFDDFCREVERPERTVWDVRTAAGLIWRILRLLLWLMVLQVLHHFLPAGAFLRGLEDAASVPYKRLVLAMYLHGQYFMLGYVQFYGWPGVVARLDGVRLLHWPDCISRVYTYKQMWRVFDRGLATFMHNHIYVPLGGSRHGVARQVAAVAASFAFVNFYHGDTDSVRIWTALNAAQLLLEVAVEAAYRARVRHWLNQYISSNSHQRVVAFVIGCNLILTSCYIFVFLVGHTGLLLLVEIFKPLVLERPLWHLILLFYLSYCSVQASLRYESSNRSKQKRE